MEIMKKAWRSGTSGYKAMVLEVGGLMWLHTIMNYQYKHGTSIMQTLHILYQQGGVKRFYSGLGYSLINAPMIKFSDTFTNTMTLMLLDHSKIPLFAKTAIVSTLAWGVKLLLMPIDTIKTMYQVNGDKAMGVLSQKITTCGISVLYHGALANSFSSIIGHYFWFVTHNYLECYLPKSKAHVNTLMRNAIVGFSSSFTSNVFSNIFRVIKIARQTSEENNSYIEVIKGITMKDGILGLFFRGIEVRFMASGIQGLLFNVLWKYFDGKHVKCKYK